MERDIEDKREEMRILEQRIVESGEVSISSASLVEMQQVMSHYSFFNLIGFLFYGDLCLSHSSIFCQTLMKLMTQCSEKGFELEVLTGSGLP